MQDRDVSVCVRMKASEVEVTRALVKFLAEFPTVAWNYSNLIAELMQREESDADERLAQLGPVPINWIPKRGRV